MAIDPAALLQAVVTHNWYAVAALTLMVLLQIMKTRGTSWWQKIPTGARFLWPIGLAAATAFTHAFLVGKALPEAGMEVLRSLWLIALPAMGGAALLKESPIPWDGGAGGAQKEAPDTDPGPDSARPGDDDRPTPVDPSVTPPDDAA